jgi:uncharacterized Zn-finger protein
MNQPTAVEVSAKDLQGGTSVFCPNPKMQIWNTHPRVFLDVVTTGSAKCPYCGTEYKLKDGQTVHAH